MDLVSEHGRLPLRRKLEEEEEEESPEDEGSPPKPNDNDPQKQSLMNSQVEKELPTEVPVTKLASSHQLPPDATFTDLAKQEVGKFMGDETQPSVSSSSSSSATQGDNNTLTDLAKQELEPLVEETEDKGYEDVEPSEMDIIVPETEEEEEEIEEEIEEWEEAHGKEKPKPEEPVVEEEESIDLQDEYDNGPDDTDIPQTEEEEETDPGISLGDGDSASPEDKVEGETSTSTAAPSLDDLDSATPEDKVEGETSTSTAAPSLDDLDSASPEDKVEGETSTSTAAPSLDDPINDPLVVSPSWTPPKVQPKHTLAPAPTVSPREPKKPSAFETPGGATAITQEAAACQEYGTQTAAYLMCKNNIPPLLGQALIVGLPLLILLCCCWKYCCGGSKKKESGRGEYRQIANTYGDASFDNAFSEDISDDEGDLEDASWGESNGRQVLEMRNLGRRKGDDDLDLEEMNG